MRVNEADLLVGRTVLVGYWIPPPPVDRVARGMVRKDDWQVRGCVVATSVEGGAADEEEVRILYLGRMCTPDNRLAILKQRVVPRPDRGHGHGHDDDDTPIYVHLLDGLPSDEWGLARYIRAALAEPWPQGIDAPEGSRRGGFDGFDNGGGPSVDHCTTTITNVVASIASPTVVRRTLSYGDVVTPEALGDASLHPRRATVSEGMPIDSPSPAPPGSRLPLPEVGAGKRMPMILQRHDGADISEHFVTSPFTPLAVCREPHYEERPVTSTSDEQHHEATGAAPPSQGHNGGTDKRKLLRLDSVLDDPLVSAVLGLERSSYSPQAVAIATSGDSPSAVAPALNVEDGSTTLTPITLPALASAIAQAALSRLPPRSGDDGGHSGTPRAVSPIPPEEALPPVSALRDTTLDSADAPPPPPGAEAKSSPGGRWPARRVRRVRFAAGAAPQRRRRPSPSGLSDRCLEAMRRLDSLKAIEHERRVQLGLAPRVPVVA